jgi:hypothetical protein
MVDQGLLRLLELVVRECECSDARVELGGRAPTSQNLVFRDMPSGGRVVAVFESPPPDRSRVEARLDAIVSSFASMAEQIGPPSSRLPPDMARRRLDDELTRLADQASAKGAVVFDMTSPMVWGASRTGDPSADTLLEDTVTRVHEAQGELRPGHTMRMRVNATIDALARPFAGVYILALAFDGVESELSAMGAILHAMPLVEKLVLALPPVDPPPEGGKLMRMPTRLR